jgi:predicted nuclease with TOPRIM domain
MTEGEKALATFQTRVRQMILRFQELKKENNALHVQLQKDEQEIVSLKSKLAQADNNYNSLKMARMLEISDGNLEEAKERLAKMIRQVNKCIAILSNEQ